MKAWLDYIRRLLGMGPAGAPDVTRHIVRGWWRTKKVCARCGGCDEALMSPCPGQRL